MSSAFIVHNPLQGAHASVENPAFNALQTILSKVSMGYMAADNSGASIISHLWNE